MAVLAGLAAEGPGTAVFFNHWYREPVVQHYLGRISEADFEKRIGEINRFEKMLAEEGVLLLKLNLHLSGATTAQAPEEAGERSGHPLARHRMGPGPAPAQAL